MDIEPGNISKEIYIEVVKLRKGKKTNKSSLTEVMDLNFTENTSEWLQGVQLLECKNKIKEIEEEIYLFLVVILCDGLFNTLQQFQLRE